MSSTFYFNNRQISLPGVYSTIISGETGPARNLDYGKVLVVDTGTYSAGFGGGAGINGENTQGQNAIYTFDNLSVECGGELQKRYSHQTLRILTQ